MKNKTTMVHSILNHGRFVKKYLQIKKNVNYPQYNTLISQMSSNTLNKLVDL